MRLAFLCLGLITAAFGPLAQNNGALSIDSPGENAPISGIVEVIGTAASPGMTLYRLEFAYDPNPTDTWFLVAENAAAVRDGLLASWDTTAIREGIYILRLTSILDDGSSFSVEVTGIQVRRAPAAVVESGVENIPAAVEPSITADRPSEIVFPAPAATPVPVLGDDTGASFAYGQSGVALAMGVIFSILAFAVWFAILRWNGWQRQKLLRTLRKSGSRNE